MGRASIITVLLVVSVGSEASAAPPSVFTSTTDSHACLPLESGVLAATDGGLVDIDWTGRVRHAWTALDGLGGTRARALHKLGDRVLVGTENGVAVVKVTRDGLSVEKRLASKPVRAFADIGGVIYVATWGQGLLELSADHKSLAPVRFSGRKIAGRDRVTAVVEHGGAVHVATAGAGIYRLSDRRLRRVAGKGRLVWSLASRGGVLYAGTVAGLVIVSDNKLKTVADGDIRSLVVTASVRGARPALWVGTFGDGAYQYRGRLVRAGLPEKARFVHGIARARSRACVSTSAGVWLQPTSASRWVAARFSPAPAGNDISALARDGARLWVGTFDQGLSVYDGRRWRRFVHSSIDLKINALAVTRGSVWVATAAGLSRIRGERVTRLGPVDGLPGRHILSLAPMPDGRLLVGTTRGAAVVSDDGIVALGRKQGVLVGNVWAVATDVDGYLWLGTTKGLYRGKPGGSWARFSLSSGHLRDDWVMALVIKDRRVWAGTYKGGIARFDWSASSVDNVSGTLLGKGWVNPGGLTLAGDILYAATMDGLFACGTTSPSCRSIAGGPGVDTTATVTTDRGIWVATRRGLVHRRR